MPEYLRNFSHATLTADINDTTSQIPISDYNQFPQHYQYRISIENEILWVASRNGNVLTASRGVEGTTRVSHLSGTDVRALLTAEGLYMSRMQEWGANFPPRLIPIDYLTVFYYKLEPFYSWDNYGSAGAATLQPNPSYGGYWDQYGSWSAGIHQGALYNLGAALDFSHYLYTTSTAGDFVGNSLTVSIWAKVHKFIDVTYPTLVAKLASLEPPTFSYRIGLSGISDYKVGYTGTVKVGSSTTTLSVSPTSVDAIPLNVWTHLALVVDGATQTTYLYRDGDMVASAASGSGNINWGNHEAMNVGGTAAGGVFCSLDDIRVERTARTKQHLESIYLYGMNMIDTDVVMPC